MNLSEYFQTHNGRLTFEPAKASAFAKQVAGDFNPLHDPDNKRFCVPGDLLFCVLLNQYGLHENIAVEFAGMLDGTSSVSLPSELGDRTHLKDSRDRDVLIATCRGKKTDDAAFVSELSEQYVKFSGKTFPDVLEPLMREHDVMINPTRPLVIYQSMQLSMDKLSGGAVDVSLSNATLDVEGKKGLVELAFELVSDNQLIGKGSKSMVLGGLRPFDATSMQTVVDDYNALKSAAQ